jgi:hypothetical protein
VSSLLSKTVALVSYGIKFAVVHGMRYFRLFILPFYFFYTSGCGQRQLSFDLSVPNDDRHRFLSDRVTLVRAHSESGHIIQKVLDQGWQGQGGEWTLDEDVPRQESWQVNAYDMGGLLLLQGQGDESDDSGVVAVELREVSL